MIFRGLEARDYQQFAEIHHRHFGGHGAFLTAEILAAPTAGSYLVAVNGDGGDDHVLAGALVSDLPGRGDERRVDIYTGQDPVSDAPWAFLHDGIRTLLAAEGVRRLTAVIRSDHRSKGRLEAAGYRLRWRSWGAHLVLDDPLPDNAFADVIAACADDYAVAEISQEHHATAYRLYTEALPDFVATTTIPAHEYSPEEFAEHLAGNRAFAVLAGDTCVALTVFEVADAGAEHDFTVVAAALRGRGLAKFVNAVAIRTLAAAGVREIGAGAAVENEAALRTARSLGFVVDPFWHTYHLDL